MLLGTRDFEMSVFTRMSSEKRAKLLNEQRFTSSREGEVGK
jgi:hypothetical protein